MSKWVGRVHEEEVILWARRPELRLLMLLRIALWCRERRTITWTLPRRAQ